MQLGTTFTSLESYHKLRAVPACSSLSTNEFAYHANLFYHIGYRYRSQMFTAGSKHKYLLQHR